MWLLISHVVTITPEMERFYTEPTLEILNSLKKKELLDAAKHYKLEVTDSASKVEIKKLVLDYLVEEEWIAEPETVSTDELRGPGNNY